ncbi:hypothetical protein WHR41_01859 [Cladosporium halotolerans]|uniref:Heterokaryon incompatibility domain-containing protein n=1 Tax=Cladosporium halotolerans TaxID=1052096 RepID=A0AB34KX70_9PEZI
MAENPFARLFTAQPASSTIATLARLAPGRQDDELAISLMTSNPSTTTYDCISYDRSREYEKTEVSVDGKPMAIPQPLLESLKAFRHKTDHTVLWADLLTGDTAEERSKQASVMKEVLQNARTVYCYAGSCQHGRSKDAYSVIQTLANWWRQAALHANFPKKLSMATTQHMLDVQTSLLARNTADLLLEDKDLWKDIFGVLSSPYFETAQAITDIILGKKVLVCSENGSIPWEDFTIAYNSALMILSANGVEIPEKVQKHFVQVSSIHVSVQRYDAGETLELFPMLQTVRDASSPADPRELVFSMLPIVTPSGRVKILGSKPEVLPAADYSKSVQQVFTEAAKHIIHERQDLLIWWKESPPCGKKITGLPSFAPDWSAGLSKDVPAVSTTSGLRMWWDNVKTKKRIYVDDEGLLHVQAHAIDRVTTVSPILTKENWRRTLLNEWKSGQKVPGESPSEVMDRFWRALVLDTDADFGETMRDIKKPDVMMRDSFQSILAEEMILDHLSCTLEQLSTDPNLQARARADELCRDLGPSTGKSQEYEALVLRNSLGRRMFKTRNGKIGMTAVETPAPRPDQPDGSPAPPMPDFSSTMNDPLGRSMMAGFQNFLAKRDGKAASALSKAMSGTLPGQFLPGVRYGDVVVALVGGFQPYILRAKDADVNESIGSGVQADSLYSFVGDCHLQGEMDGERFKEPAGFFFSGGWKSDVPLVDVVIS